MVDGWENTARKQSRGVDRVDRKKVFFPTLPDCNLAAFRESPEAAEVLIFFSMSLNESDIHFCSIRQVKLHTMDGQFVFIFANAKHNLRGAVAVVGN